MKIFIFCLLFPLFTQATTGEGDLPKEFSSINYRDLGIDLGVSGKLMATKTIRLTSGEMSHELKLSMAGNVLVENAKAISYQGKVKNISIAFNKANGQKYLASIIEKYGLPGDDVADNFEWTVNNIRFEIHETKTGFEVNYSATGEFE